MDESQSKTSKEPGVLMGTVIAIFLVLPILLAMQWYLDTPPNFQALALAAVPQLHCDAPSFEWDAFTRKDQPQFDKWIAGTEPTLFLGPSGSGKTATFQQSLSTLRGPCIYVNDPAGMWGSLARSFGMPSTLDSSIIMSTIKAVLERQQSLQQPVSLFVDHIFERPLSASDMDALSWLVRISGQGIACHFMSSKTHTSHLPILSSLGLRTQYVPHVAISEIQEYLLKVTNMTQEQAERTIRVVGVSLADMRLALKVALNKSSEELEAPLQKLLEDIIDERSNLLCKLGARGLQQQILEIIQQRNGPVQIYNLSQAFELALKDLIEKDVLFTFTGSKAAWFAMLRDLRLMYAFNHPIECPSDLGLSPREDVAKSEIYPDGEKSQRFSKLLNQKEV